MSNEIMTDGEYTNYGGNRCPVCHSENIEGGSWESDNEGATQEVSCTDCSSEWQDFHERKGFILQRHKGE